IGIGVNRPPPLLMTLLMAVPAILCGGKNSGVEKFAGIGRRIRGYKGEGFTKAIVVFYRDLFRIFVAGCRGFIRLTVGLHRSRPENDQTCQAEPKNQSTCGDAPTISDRHFHWYSYLKPCCALTVVNHTIGTCQILKTEVEV